MLDVPLDRVREIFVGCLRCETSQEIEQLIQRECAGDRGLGLAVHDLLRAHDANRSFLEKPLDKLLVGHALDAAATQSLASTAEEVSPNIGPYKLLEQIGQGGMGAVYMAQQTAPVKRKVALKIIKPGMDSKEVIARFEAERQALALMDHPNIARVLDGGATSQGRPYFVMELVRGVPITDYCREKKLGLDQRLELLIDVCRAVQHAHLKGIIHRDLKPSNILVTLHDGVPVVKVIDFGVAKALNQELTERTLFTRFSQMIGTPLYMAPEQAEMSGLDIDTRSDIYSLGVVLYELLTGTTPFDKESISKLGFDGFRKALKEQEPPRPSVRISTLKAANLSTLEDRRQLSTEEVTRKLKRELDWIVMKALEKDRERRYETAAALAADVQRFLDNEPVLACPPSVAYRLSKFLRRHRSRVAVGAAGLVAVLLVAGVVMNGRWERNRQALEATQAVELSLASAKTAIETRSLVLAEQNLVEARTRLDLIGTQRVELERQIGLVQANIEQGRADEQRFSDFIALARKAQDTLSYGGNFLAQGPVDARNALGQFGVLDDTEWTDSLNRSQLSQEQQAQVRETAYETLLLLADSNVRWPQFKSATAAQDGLTLLEKASAFHEPTKALYWVRMEIHKYLKDETAAKSDQALYDSTPAKTAWDWYLPGHTAGWRGDRATAKRAYHEALRLQPDHYNSLFFLAQRLAADEQYAEAIAYFTGCLALRPDHISAILSRAESYDKMGDKDSAERDFRSAVDASAPALEHLWAFAQLLDYLRRTKQVEKHAEVVARLQSESARLIDDQAKQAGSDNPSTLELITGIGVQLCYAFEYGDGITFLEIVLERRRKLHNGPHENIFLALIDLGTCLTNADRVPEAIGLFEEALAMSIELHGPSDKGPDHPKILFAKYNLAAACLVAEQYEVAVNLLEQLVETHTRLRGDNHQETLHASAALLKAYLLSDRRDDFRRLALDRIEFFRRQADEIQLSAELAVVVKGLLSFDEFAAAEPLARECLELRRDLLPGTWQAFNAQSQLGAVYLGQGKIKEAEPLLVEAIAGLEAQRDQMPPPALENITLTIERLVALYKSKNDPEDLARWEKRLKEETAAQTAQ